MLQHTDEPDTDGFPAVTSDGHGDRVLGALATVDDLGQEHVYEVAAILSAAMNAVIGQQARCARLLRAMRAPSA